MESLLLALLATTASAAPSPNSQPPAIPLTYNYGGYPRIQADIAWGTPPQKTIPTIFDTGSSGFWVYGPNATINDGSQYHYTVGPCNKSVHNFYNWPASKTHAKLDTKHGYAFAYGGNGEIVQAPSSINDSFSFGNTKWPALSNNEVALANWTVVAQGDAGCKIPESDFDHSILGLAPISPATSGPSFRGNLLSQGKTKSSSFSMWFDKPPKSAKGSYQGTAIFGAIPSKSKYSGELVRLKQTPSQGTYVGYYVSVPKLTATSITKPGKGHSIGVSDNTVKQCLLDSGTGQDRLPFSQKQALSVTGLIEYDKEASFLAWNGSCDSIPPAATLNYTFAGATAGKSVTIAVPIRSYARGEFDQIPGVDTSKVCGLSLSLDEYGDCTFGAPFFTAAFAVFNDEKKQVALAQGGVSTGAADGPGGLGPVTVIGAGQDVPGSV
ncbi:hypothetical protein PRZ48_010525 [Zasmidium cellare]|uniref:Peptidase A1 domain-containing protein n=1 Tax=Zasmidium cellare TaxID=395010 RepID=A0ABR0E8W3_ZASCE|nr:hypothetical protein PRZ48_010525 [Zasmidium cellare]